MNKKLYRDEQRKTIGGVCVGLADYFNIEVSIVRALFLLALVLKGSGVVLYIILWIVLPKKEFALTDPFNPGVDYRVPPQNDFEQSFVNKPRRSSSAGIIAGFALIVVGLLSLLDNFDLIPDIDFEHLWPLVLVTIGITLIFTSKKNKTAEPKPPIN